jgi:hypothetical protein
LVPAGPGCGTGENFCPFREKVSEVSNFQKLLIRVLPGALFSFRFLAFSQLLIFSTSYLLYFLRVLSWFTKFGGGFRM